MHSSRDYPEPQIVPALRDHQSTVFLIHGLNDSADTWVHYAPKLGEDLPHTKFIFPTASKMPVVLYGGRVINGWYNVVSLDTLNVDEDRESLHASARYIHELVRKEVDSGIDARKIIVAGFSQGGVIALLQLRQPTTLAGVLCLSGYLMLADEPPLFSEANARTPVLLCNGEKDDVVDFEYGLRSEKLLREAGANLSFLRYPDVGHTVAPEVLEDVKSFLKKHLT